MNDITVVIFPNYMEALSESYVCVAVAVAERFDEASPLWSFATAMEEIIQLLPTARFFVCSNSHAVKQLLLDRFGDNRILTITLTDADIHLSSDRASERGIEMHVLYIYIYMYMYSYTCMYVCIYIHVYIYVYQ